MNKISTVDIAELPLDERIQLVEDIWDTIAELPDTVEVPDWHKAELDKRLESYHANDREGTPWSELKAKLLQG